VSTRRLIITALVCGMAILLAGGVFLVRLAGTRADRIVTFHAVGDAVRVGDLTVTVTGVSGRADAVVVGIDVDATAATLAFPTDAGAPWSLLLSGKLRAPVAPPAGATACAGQQIASGRRVTCDLAFARGDGTGFLAFDWRGTPVRWRLALAGPT